MTKKQKGTLYHEEQGSAGQVDGAFNQDEAGDRSQFDMAARAKLGNEMDDELLNEIGAIGDTGNEGSSGESLLYLAEVFEGPGAGALSAAHARNRIYEFMEKLETTRF